jgi:dCTP deaminase
MKNLTQGGGYELRMGREAFTTALGQRVVLTDVKNDIEIPPGHFGLLLTKERVRIPRDSIGFISIKFRWKAKGLINVSGFHVDPGYDGWLTFSVFNAGPRPITICRDASCFLLWLAHWDEPVEESHLYPSDKAGARGSTENLQDSMVDELKGEFCSPMSLKQEFEAYKERQVRLRWIAGTIVAAVVFLLGATVGAIVSKVVDAGYERLTAPTASPSDAETQAPASVPGS